MAWTSYDGLASLWAFIFLNFYIDAKYFRIGMTQVILKRTGRFPKSPLTGHIIDPNCGDARPLVGPKSQ